MMAVVHIHGDDWFFFAMFILGVFLCGFALGSAIGRRPY